MTTNQTISFPRELSDELGELIAKKARVCGGGAFDIWEAICEQFGTTGLQPRGNPEGKREYFEKWVMATKHPVFGFLDGRSLARGDDRTGYADEYVQGLWVAYLEFGAAQPHGDPAPVAVSPIQEDRETLIGYGRSSGLDEASTLCNRMAYAAYYPPGTRFKAFTPKAQKALGDLLIKAANEIASLPGGPYERFKARQAKKAESAKSR